MWFTTCDTQAEYSLIECIQINSKSNPLGNVGFVAFCSHVHPLWLSLKGKLMTYPPTSSGSTVLTSITFGHCFQDLLVLAKGLADSCNATEHFTLTSGKSPHVYLGLLRFNRGICYIDIPRYSKYITSNRLLAILLSGKSWSGNLAGAAAHQIAPLATCENAWHQLSHFETSPECGILNAFKGNLI